MPSIATNLLYSALIEDIRDDRVDVSWRVTISDLGQGAEVQCLRHYSATLEDHGTPEEDSRAIVRARDQDDALVQATQTFHLRGCMGGRGKTVTTVTPILACTLHNEQPTSSTSLIPHCSLYSYTVLK